MQDISRHKKQLEIPYVRKRPTIFVGDIKCHDERVYLFEDGKFSERVVKTNDALVKIINEVIDNCLDNMLRDPPTTKIEMTFGESEIVVSNDGQHLEVEKNKEGVYIPSGSFGELRFSSNFDDNKREDTIGCFGLGVKMTNILSKTFSIRCVDPIANKILTQTWTEGMTKTSGPVVKDGVPKSNRFITTVTFVPDLEYFGVESLDVFRKIIHSRLIQVLFTRPQKLSIKFNGEKLPRKSFKDSIKMFTDEKFFYHREHDRFEYAISLSNDGQFKHVSFVNSQRTSDPSSTQTAYVTSKIVSLIVAEVKKKNKSVKHTQTLTNMIMNKLQIFINIHVKAAQFSTQNKEKMVKDIDAKEYPLDPVKIGKLIKRSGVVDLIIARLQENTMAALTKTLSATKKRKVVVEKLIDAEQAGLSKSRDCVLFITEGDSALGMVRIGLSVVGTQFYGGFPIRGKMVNVNDKAHAILSKNEEIKNIVKIVGLDVSKSYETEEDMNTLRYGHIAILSDQDHDGSHICGLLLNLLYKFWPKLVERQFVQRFITPYVRATSKTQVHEFYNMKAYEQWFEQNKDSADNFEIKAYKGLGTSLREDSVRYFTNITKHLKTFTCDEHTKDDINKVFKGENSNVRKQWLSEPPSEPLDYTKNSFSISSFLNSEVYEYSMHSIKRAVPSLVDGFKTSHRQVIHTLLNCHKSDAEIKVVQLAGKTATHVEYLHGEESLVGTIIGLAQSFSGSNNIPLLVENGYFGSRSGGEKKYRIGGDSASGRYLFTKLRKGIRGGLFNNDDLNIISYRVVEGKSVEPEFFVPELPLVLINGSNGIATGFRTVIPSFNPKDIVSYIQAHVGGQEKPPLVPWYDKFNGTVVKNESGGWKMSGCYSFDSKKGTITITELPVGVGTNVVSFMHYEFTFLPTLEKEGIITKYKASHPDENHCQFVCHLSSSYLDKATDNAWVLKTFNLESTISNTCFYVLNEEGRVVKFDKVEDILDKWIEIRIKYMQKRKEYLKNLLNTNLTEETYRLKFVQAVVDGTLVIAKRSKVDIVKSMESFIPQMYHDKFLAMSMISISQDKIDSLKKKIEGIKAEITTTEQTCFTERYISEISTLTFDNTTQTKVKRPNKKRKV